ncbi:MAG TPA: hypothetical protein DHV55_17255 [Clostridiaceae bacterium]|nr:hypothetical protein [Clostridiaceae bacterium]
MFQQTWASLVIPIAYLLLLTALHIIQEQVIMVLRFVIVVLKAYTIVLAQDGILTRMQHGVGTVTGSSGSMEIPSLM